MKAGRKDKRQMSRLTWGGLLRILNRRPKSNYDHEHIKILFPDGTKQYLNVKYDVQGHPYFVIVKERRSHE